MPKITPENEEKLNDTDAKAAAQEVSDAQEVGGPKGLEPTRYGDWERNGKCVDF